MEGVAFGRYQLLSRLDEQFLGYRRPVIQVWEAVDTVHDRVVALRLISAELSQNDGFNRWFRDRVTAAEGLTGLHTVQIHDHGQMGLRLFVETQLIAGRNLKTLLEGGPLDPWDAVLVLQGVADALDTIHHRGSVHDNVKPSDVLVTGHDGVYLDVVNVKSEAIERSQMLLGTDPDMYQPETYHYMAPERITRDYAANPLPQSDVYSLACVLYECLTGRPPFASDSLQQVLIGHISGSPTPPSNIRQTLPAELDPVILKGLAKDPTERFASATELILAAKTTLASRHEQSRRSPDRFGGEQPSTPVEQARPAIAAALFRRHRAVPVRTSSQAQYVETVFPGLRPETPVYASDEEILSSTAPVSPGPPPPAFGIYQPLVHPNYPLLAILILEGTGTVDSTSLDEHLFAYCADHAADERARRLMSGLAFLEPSATIDTHQISPGVGVVFPQVAGRPPIVYRLSSPGPHARIRYRKFLVPRADRRSVNAARELGFTPWRLRG